ncbi:MAG: polysulfide reductase NrfD [Rhizobacter sp.]|nr:polysulfide reductase NrfD [Rhizobacter sp.]
MEITFREIEGRSKGYWGLLALLGALVLAGLASAWTMEHQGHVVTGMSNRIVWGLPHVFAVFLIVAASGALNVASIASVFGRMPYKPLARLSGLLAIALLVGGLAVLLLDLGRPDRLIVAMTHYNFKSIFAWNVFLYTGFLAIVVLYLWLMMERRMNRFVGPAGLAALVWRLALTTGTGSIFGFLVARQAFDSALLAPMFIALSFSYGLAVMLLVLLATAGRTGRPLGAPLLARLVRLQAIFVAAVLYFVLVQHLSHLYVSKRHDFERFILLDGGGYTQLFWLGQVLLGNVMPLVLLLWPGTRESLRWVSVAAGAVVLGGLAQMAVTIIGAQAFPLVLFPGRQESSSFYDGVVMPYTPSLPELGLGLGGAALAVLIVLVAIKLLAFLPQRLDEAIPETSPTELVAQG